jgi:hypothetical protein
MKTILAVVGGIVITLSILGAVGVGHFRLYYGAAQLTCAPGDAA